jgi:hypothetical protein
MYTNISTNDIISLVRTVLKHHNTQHKTTNEVINITNNILLHYFQFVNTYYRQEGLEMGVPSPAILAEIYLQHI